MGYDLLNFLNLFNLSLVNFTQFPVIPTLCTQLLIHVATASQGRYEGVIESSNVGYDLFDFLIYLIYLLWSWHNFLMFKPFVLVNVHTASQGRYEGVIESSDVGCEAKKKQKNCKVVRMAKCIKPCRFSSTSKHFKDSQKVYVFVLPALN